MVNKWKKVGEKSMRTKCEHLVNKSAKKKWMKNSVKTSVKKKLQKVAICCQKLPFVTKSCQKLPFVAKSCLLFPKVAGRNVARPAAI